MSKGFKKAVKWLMWLVIGLIGLVVLIFSLLYVPAVQDYAVQKALSIINKGGDLEISAKKVRLKFPLKVEVDSVMIMQKGDTMLLAGHLRAAVAPMPLLAGDIQAKDLKLNDIYFKQGTPDSLLYLRARVMDAELNKATVNLARQSVDLDEFALNGGRVDLAIGLDTIVKPATPPGDVKWNIKAKRLTVSYLEYDMTMVSMLSDLGVQLNKLSVDNASVDLGSNAVAIEKVAIDTVAARVFTDPEIVVPQKVAPIDTFPSKPWIIGVNSLQLKGGDALYARKGVAPKPGFDLDYIQVSRIDIDVDTFRMKGTEMRVPLTHLSGRERSGLQLNATGVYEMDSTALRVKDFDISTLASNFNINLLYGLGQPADVQPINARISAQISPADLQIALPDMAKMIAMLPRGRKIDVGIYADGSLSDLHVERVFAGMDRYWDIALKGDVVNVTNLNDANGHLNIAGNFADVNFLKPTVRDLAKRQDLKLPPLKLNGNVALARGIIDGDLKATTPGGDVALDAKWNNRKTGYDIDLNVNSFPVHSFLPGLGVGNVTAKAKVNGQRQDKIRPKTSINALAEAIDVQYNGHKISNLTLDANLSGGNADVKINSTNSVLDALVAANGNLAGNTYDWQLTGDVRHIDLRALGLSDSVMTISTQFDGKCSISPKSKALDANLNVGKINLLLNKQRVTGTDITATFNATDSTTAASIANHDLLLSVRSPMPLDSILPRVNLTMTALDSMIAKRRADVIELQQLMPEFTLDLKAGNKNIVSNFLASSGTSFRSVSMSMSNDSLINIAAKADTVTFGQTRLDHIDFTAVQRNEYLRYRLFVNNEPGTFDEFAKIQANGYLAEDRFSIFLRQENIQGKTGYNLGSVVAMTDSTLIVKFVPYKPVIAYKQWNINNDNFIKLNTRHPHLDANLMMGNGISSLHLYTQHDSTAHEHEQERIYLQINDVKIQEWLALSPYAPPMKGDLSADINVGMENKSLNGRGTVTLADFTYNKRRVGTFDLGLDLTTNRSGALHASTSLSIDGREVITAAGALNDTAAAQPFLLDFNVDRLPLAVANPFISTTGKLSGYLNGHMDVTGSLKEPKFDGYVAFDSASVTVAMIGSSFRFSDNKIPVDSNVVTFTDYPIFGANKNPLTINGTVDARRITDIGIDLRLAADNMQVVDNNKKRGADVYGKAFVSLDATAKGNLHFINVNANLSVNPQTNVTYIIPDATTALASRSNSKMVKFVNFADTLAVENADSLAPPPTAVNITALLNIETGATIGVDLSADGKNRAQLQPSGTLDFTLNPFGDQRLTGRVNVNSGYVRYTPPLMSEKLFNFDSNSYVTFSGNMMDPNLNIIAVDHVLANVTQEGQNSRLITFDVTLKVTGTLDQMNINFDLSTEDDVTVENELQSMSPEQRANQAMNLLLYNTYTGPNTRGNANIGGNALYSFLESTVNSWMANNIKGVDISFGIDQYQRTYEGNSSTATSYSYKVSKSFLDDRIKIVVGGNYSTDIDPDESVSENLINDISVEYYLNNSGTMYLRLFRHTGFESILEGEVTQTGVGFVFKRKLRSLRDLFHRKPKSPKPTPVSQQ